MTRLTRVGDPPAPEHEAGVDARLVLVIVCAGVVLASLDLFIVNVASAFRQAWWLTAAIALLALIPALSLLPRRPHTRAGLSAHLPVEACGGARPGYLHSSFTRKKVTMQIAGRTALVTGANRGLGRHLAEQLRDRGATVYAAARNPDMVQLAGVKPIRLDVTDPESIQHAAAATSDISILINNAGSSTGASLLTGELSDIRLEIDTHYLGSLLVTRAFAPQLGQADHRAVLNVLSVLSWISFPAIGAYCAAKAAAWSMTNALRQELAAQPIQVSALHVVSSTGAGGSPGGGPMTGAGVVPCHWRNSAQGGPILLADRFGAQDRMPPGRQSSTRNTG